jgi:hypothetical protein
MVRHRFGLPGPKEAQAVDALQKRGTAIFAPAENGLWF